MHLTITVVETSVGNMSFVGVVKDTSENVNLLLTDTGKRMNTKTRMVIY